MANRFWVGGNGTWDLTNNGHWATTSGGTGNQNAPTSADAVTFDGNSGAGAVITVNADVVAASVALGVTGGNFTGTLDFSANNNSPTFGTFAFSGSGTRTLNLGNGAWSLTAATNSTVWNTVTTTGLTFNANSSTITISNPTTTTLRVFTGGGLSFNNVEFNGLNQITGNNSFVSLTLFSGCQLTFPTGTTIISSILVCDSISNSVFNLMSNGQANTVTTISLTGGGAVDMTRTVFSGITFSGATVTAENSINVGHTSGITITPPTMTRSRGFSGFA